MALIALETASDACSVALVDGECVYAFHRLSKRAHIRLILPAVARVLKESGLQLGELEAIAFGCGPGSFTGTRLALSVAQGLAFGAGLPVVAVSTLATIAQGYCRECEVASGEIVAVIQDARMSEFSLGVYRWNGACIAPLCAERLAAAQDVQIDMAWIEQGCHGVGDGWVSPQTFAALPWKKFLHIDAERKPSAVDVAALACVEGAEKIEPSRARAVYLREAKAWKSAPR